MANHEYSIDLAAAALMMRMPQSTVLKCVRYQARRNGGLKLHVKDVRGKPMFRKTDIDAYLDDLRKPWASDAKDRPAIPEYFQQYLLQETRLHCGLCGSPLATDYAHIVDWAVCLHHHPWNLLCVCSECHQGHDVEKRISPAELERAKRRAEADFRDFIETVIPEEQLLNRLRSIAVDINGAKATGIDFLISAIIPGSTSLDVSKFRVVSMLGMIGDGKLHADPRFTLTRLSELSLLHLANNKAGVGFWNETSRSLYEFGLFPNFYINLTTGGQDVIDFLQSRPAQFIDISKYRGFSDVPPSEFLHRITSHLWTLQAEQNDRDRVPFLELDTWDT